MMFIATILAASLAPFALGAPAFQLPCSVLSGTPCVCPPGTEYEESATAAIIGAPASDVGMVMNDFFKTEWEGIEIVSVQGPDNFPGLSIRHYNISTTVGVYDMSDKLTFYFVYPDGSFEQKFEQSGAIPYYSGNGSFAGHWVTIKGDRIFENETLVTLTTYACQTGHPVDFGQFHSSGIINTTSILIAGGLATGVSAGPFSAQAF